MDLTDAPSSAPKESMPEVRGLVGSPALETTGALLSPPTRPTTRGTSYKDVSST